MNKSFVDSNVWIYAFAGDGDPRGKIVRTFLENAPRDAELVISYQIVNETTRVLKKHGLPEPELRRVINDMFLMCEVCAFSQTGAAAPYSRTAPPT